VVQDGEQVVCALLERHLLKQRNLLGQWCLYVGAKEVDERGNGIGFVTNTEEVKKEIIEKEMKRKFKPEFINRIDKIIYFNKLTNDNIKFIISLEIDKIRKRLQSMGYDLQDNLENTDWFNNIYNNVIEKKNMGARPIIRELQTKLEDKITDYIIDNETENGHLFTVNELV
jgi:ATP-dependent Clp protease ATP-binding subunit ClpC